MKQTVYFTNPRGFSIDIGYYAYVFALNHPRLGSQHVITSTVIDVKDDETIPGGVSEFETLNTRYVHIALPDADEATESVTHNPYPLLGQADEELNW